MSKKRNIEFDENYSLRKHRPRVGKILLTILWCFLGSIVLACVYHVIFSILWTSDSDRALFRENRMYEKNYAELRSRERMLKQAIENMAQRDDEIYFNLFNTSAPSMSDLSSGSILSDDVELTSDEDIYSHIAGTVSKMESEAVSVEENFRKVFEKCADLSYSLPPMTLPLEDFNIARTGASVGKKISPFMKVSLSHDGIDLIAPVGTKVIAGGPGVVTSVVRSSVGEGNVIVIDHGNGYKSKYAHLSEISVRSGSKVKASDKIGSVGSSGKSFAPHLHYSITYYGKVCDPVNYMFGSVSPGEYASMMILSGSTGQSLD